jgi:hypothetical protein
VPWAGRREPRQYRAGPFRSNCRKYRQLLDIPADQLSRESRELSTIDHHVGKGALQTGSAYRRDRWRTEGAAMQFISLVDGYANQPLYRKARLVELRRAALLSARSLQPGSARNQHRGHDPGNPGRLHGRYVRFSGATSGLSSIPLRALPDLLREDPQQSESKCHSGALTGLRGRTGHRLSPGDRGVLQPSEESFVFRLTVFPDAWSGSIAMSGPVMMLIIHRVGLLDLIFHDRADQPP